MVIEVENVWLLESFVDRQGVARDPKDRRPNSEFRIVHRVVETVSVSRHTTERQVSASCGMASS